MTKSQKPINNHSDREVQFSEAVSVTEVLRFKEGSATRLWRGLLRYFDYKEGFTERYDLIKKVTILKSRLLSLDVVDLKDERYIGDNCIDIFAELQKRLRAE